MKLLVTGRGKSGSWLIRGEQLGHAIGATVQPNATGVKGYDAVIIVKRPRHEMLEAIRKAGILLVWDIVDAWPQPHGNDWDKAACIDWLQREVERIKPRAIVVSTKVMAEDCRQFSMPVLTLPHHSRPMQRLNPIREAVKTVYYEGGEQYLGRWGEVLQRQCSSRGWTFAINPHEMAAVDIVVAFREQTGYAARNWKSNVKLANAQGSRTPSVVAREAGYVETAGRCQYFADDEKELADSFDILSSRERRNEQAIGYLPLPLSLVANTYTAWLARL